MRKRPNIIIFNPDEMRWDTMSHMNNPAAITPNLDEIIKNDAVSFSHAFCQNPVCVPSRCSFMTGLYPHTRGHRTMSYLLHPGEDSILKELKEGGYYVWMNDRNDLTAGQIDGWTESHADEIFYNSKKVRRGQAVKDYHNNPKYKFSHFEGELKLDSDGLQYNSDDEVVDAAIERMLNPKDDKPLCMFMGLFYPHVPYQVEEPYFSAIDRKKLLKRIKLEECSGKAPILEKIKSYCAMDDLSEEEWDEIRATYLGMCMKIDNQFGRLVNALKKAGIYDDTAIFFFSDHGDFAGDYSLVEKSQNSFEDCLTRVPFLIKPPKGYEIDPGVNDNLVELIDFYATAMDMAQVKPNHTNFGRSLVKNIANKKEKAREYVFSEGGREAGEIHCDEFHADPNPNTPYWPKKMAQSFDELHDKGIMIRNNEFKYISRSRTKDELYDLINDPKETTNIIDNQEYKDVVSKMQYELMKWLQRTADIVPFEYDARFTKAMTWSKLQGMVKPQDEEKVKAFINTGAPFGACIGYVIRLNNGEKDEN